MKLAVADRRWDGRRIIVAAPGPSLTSEVAAVCGGETILAVSDAYRVFPKADVVYSCDAVWWETNGPNGDFSGERWTTHSLSPKNDKRNLKDRDKFHIIEGRAGQGFSKNPHFVHYGNNSGFQAVNLGILFGAKKIILVGFDMRTVDGKSHFFGNHKTPLRDSHSFIVWIRDFATAAKIAPDVSIINATPGSALDCFSKMSLEEALIDGCFAVAADD